MDRHQIDTHLCTQTQNKHTQTHTHTHKHTHTHTHMHTHTLTGDKYMPSKSMQDLVSAYALSDLRHCLHVDDAF